MRTSERRRWPLHTRILTGLILGAVSGVLVQAFVGPKNPNVVWFNDTIASTLGKVFLYLVFMIVVPLLFSALILGVMEIGSAARVGRLGIIALLMTVLLSASGVVIGLAGVNLVNPGKHIPEERRLELIERYSDKDRAEKSLEAAKGPEDPPVLGFIPRNPFKEINRALEGGLLPLMFFALIFGIALAGIEPEKAAPVKALFEGVFAASLKVIEYAMLFAPIGVFCLIFQTSSTLGLDLFRALGLYVALVLACLLIQLVGVYSLVLRFIAKRNPLVFFRQVWTVILTAFSTSSSNATLPTALRVAQEDVGLPRNVSAFVLTVGATANQNGTALFEGITIIFLAQLFGIDLTLAQQATLMGLAIVAGIGTAGVPGGAWPMIATVLSMFKVPAESIGVVLGIDRILDMSRTVVNVVGDMVIAASVSRFVDGDAEALAQAAAEV